MQFKPFRSWWMYRRNTQLPWRRNMYQYNRFLLLHLQSRLHRECNFLRRLVIFILKSWCKIGRKIAETIETVISFFLVYCLNVIFTFFSYHFIDLDECTDGTHNCHNIFATCQNRVGSFECSCNDGFSGDGVNCEGK